MFAASANASSVPTTLGLCEIKNSLLYLSGVLMIARCKSKNSFANKLSFLKNV